MTNRHLAELRVKVPDSQPDQCHLHLFDLPGLFVDEVLARAQAREVETAE